MYSSHLTSVGDSVQSTDTDRRGGSSSPSVSDPSSHPYERISIIPNSGFLAPEDRSFEPGVRDSHPEHPLIGAG